MRSEKTFRTLDEQIEILKLKGLVIDDIDKAKRILLRENYFFLSGYRHLFMVNSSGNQFLKNVNFDELHAMFLFDRAVRNILFKWILVVENNFKSIMSYELSKKYGFRDKDYLNPKNFTQDSMKQRQVRDILNKVHRQMRVNGRQHTATTHYIDNYGYIPLWILVKVLSFGIMSEFYNILKNEDQSEIASIYGLEPDTLSTYLAIIANYRNICAHEEILYDHKTQKCIPDSKYHSALEIPKIDGEYKYGKNDLFTLIIILKNMLFESEVVDLVNEVSYEVDKLEGKLKSINIEKVLNACGFPVNWVEIGKMD